MQSAFKNILGTEEAPLLLLEDGADARLNMQKIVPETVEMYGVES